MRHDTHFDRFDIMDAYYVYASAYHGGQNSPEYAIFARLARAGYKPARAVTYGFLESGNARQMYSALIERAHGRDEALREVARMCDEMARIGH